MRGNNTTKRILSILLCFCMVLSLLPMPVLAADEPSISIGGVVVDNNDWYATTDMNGTVTTQSAISSNCNIHVVLGHVNGTPTATVTLKDATIANISNTHAINVKGYDLNIVLEGTVNQIGTDEISNGYAIYSSTENNVTINGEGDLILKGSYGIRVNGLGDVSINTTGNLNIVSNWQMINTSGNLAVYAKSIEAAGYYFIGNSVLLNATDGDIHATGRGDNCIYAMGDVVALAPNGEISLSGTNYAIKATDHSVNVSAKNDVTVNGTVNGKAISISSETCNLTINGFYEAIENAQDSVVLSAPLGDMILNANNYSSIISGINNFSLDITAGGSIEAKGPYGIDSYGNATIKADKVFVTSTTDGNGFRGGALTITNPSGGNCSEVYISGGQGDRDAISAFRDINIKSDNVIIMAATNAKHAINAFNINTDVTVNIGNSGLIIGAINIKGTNAISEGMIHVEKNGINASYGLNLNTSTPTQSTYYKAGDGYFIFTPATGETQAKLSLHNVDVFGELTLPDIPLTMYLEGVNTIESIRASASIVIGGSGKLEAYDFENINAGATLTVNSGATLNTIYKKTVDNIRTNTIYGSYKLSEDARFYVSSSNKWVLASDAVFILQEEGNIEFHSDAILDDLIVGDNATIINNNYITLPIGTTGEQIASLPFSGSGFVRVTTAYDNYGYPETWDTYTNDGVELKIVSGDIDMTGDADHSNATLENNGYEWDVESKTLNLGNAGVLGNIKLPAGSIINIISNSFIRGTIGGKDFEAIDITIIGSAPLIVEGVSGSINGDTITIEGGANITVNGSISIGGSGGQDGTLNISGRGTMVNVISNMGSAVYCDTVNIGGGASLIANSEGSVGVFAHTGVSVTGGSTLTTNCEYGVYIIDGKLEVEIGSKLITNGTMAPFCIVEKTNSKEQSGVVSLPGIPDGAEITSVLGTGGRYWSIIPKGGSLGVSDENNEPVTLSGAFIGLATFQGNSNNGSNNSGGSNQSIYYNLTFETNGGSKISDVSKSSGTVVDLSVYKPLRAGFNFDGWYTDEALTNKVTEIKLVKNTTVYAKWIEISRNPFIDVAENSYYYDAVMWAIQQGITSGTAPNTFSPEMITTRAEMITFLWRTVGLPETTLLNSNFNDIDKDSYYYKAVLWAEENGVTVGTSATTFSPEEKVTRGQVVTFLWRFDGRVASNYANPFIDVNKDLYYYEAVLWAVEKGITNGTSKVEYSPDAPCLRAHIVTFLYRQLAN